MIFDYLDKTARALVNVAADSVEFATGGDGPSREDVAQLVSAGLTVAAIAAAFGVTEEVIEALKGPTDE